jgi:spore germination cell wall hydrolase CwlJ-like protein
VLHSDHVSGSGYDNNTYMLFADSVNTAYQHINCQFYKKCERLFKKKSIELRETVSSSMKYRDENVAMKDNEREKPKKKSKIIDFSIGKDFKKNKEQERTLNTKAEMKFETKEDVGSMLSPR